jgi:hypothetical protein
MNSKRRGDTSVRVNETRKLKLERAAIDLSYETRRQIKMADIVNYLIDNYMKDAVKDIKAKVSEGE